MRVIIKSKEIKISDDLYSYAEKRIGKLEKFLENVDPNLVEATIEFFKAVGGQRQGNIFQADVNLRIPGKFFRSEVIGGNPYSMMDDAKEELEDEIRKFKTKKETMFKRGARSVKKLYSISPLARFRKNE
ncbi:MAG: ribosome-associated translation inhibitor RaiA [bacterium]